mmetsp:Transcript_9473/g.42913  ORF Transcript_9473/g.42913 Transcript_9473/m.42913 type:complete len:215 (-) Transcript_9473:2090-2734(-)
MHIVGVHNTGLREFVYDILCRRTAIMLGARFDKHKIVAMCLLAVGMVLVQLPRGIEVNLSTSETNADFTGVCSVLLASITSGYAGVYLEKKFKAGQGAEIWTLNIQLSCYSLPCACMACFLQDYYAIRANGFFHGYNLLIAAIVLLQALGGLIVAAVMRHASTLLKCFAVSISICCCVVISALAGEFAWTGEKFLGLVIVNISTVLFSLHRRPK